MNEDHLSSFRAAPQHGPRPLPLFLEILTRETKGSPDRRAAALAGLAAYQRAERGAPRDVPPALFQIGSATLRDYSGAGLDAGADARTPVIFVPSLINPPFILDLAPDRSLLRWLAARGHRVLLIDWGTPAPDTRHRNIDGHVADLLVPLARRLGVPPVLVGYCLGGTMAAAAASLMPVRALGMIAAPWRFAGFDDAARARIAALWQRAEPICRRLGLIPMEVLQSAFWALDPARVIAKYESFSTMPPDSDAARTFVVLEDWANGGAPLTYAAGAQMFDFFARDLPGVGGWRIGDRVVDPHALRCPTIDFVSTTDRIVPIATAAGFATRYELRAGHVGMVVGGSAPDQLWGPLADWISCATGARQD